MGLLQAGFNRMAEGLLERERLRDLFGRHVGEDVAKAALRRGTKLGGEEREVGVLFVDLVGSSSLALAMQPSDVVRLLNLFFRVVVETAEVHGGLVNKFEGDGALCVFGAPVSCEDPAGDSMRAARDLATRLRREVPSSTSASACPRAPRSPATSRPSIAIARRIERNGAFAGVAAIFISARIMEQFWSSLDLGANSTVSMVRTDGWVIARYPSPPAPLNLSEYELFTVHYKAAETGSYIGGRSPADGVSRTVGYRQIEGLPVLALASISTEETLKTFWRGVSIVLALFVPI